MVKKWFYDCHYILFLKKKITLLYSLHNCTQMQFFNTPPPFITTVPPSSHQTHAKATQLGGWWHTIHESDRALRKTDGGQDGCRVGRASDVLRGPQGSAGKWDPYQSVTLQMLLTISSLHASLCTSMTHLTYSHLPSVKRNNCELRWVFWSVLLRGSIFYSRSFNQGSGNTPQGVTGRVQNMQQNGHVCTVLSTHLNSPHICALRFVSQCATKWAIITLYF